MFGWNSALGLPTVGAQPEIERRPPPPPTTLDFPAYDPLTPTDHHDPEAALREIHQILASIRKPQDISREKFQAFNVRVESDLPAARIVRQDAGSHSVPALPWEDTSPHAAPVMEDGSPCLLENGNPYPAKERFEVLKNELLFDNDDAFREVARLPPREGRERVRVAQARKFWMGLERLAGYWDASLDEYFERPATPEPTSDADKMQVDSEMPAVAPAQTTHPTPAMEVDPLKKSFCAICPPAPENHTPPQEAQPKLVERYKGRRIGAGHEMPEDIREETVRALAEMAAWPFGCQVALPILPPRLAVRTLLFPVRQTFGAARSPRDRQLARSGVMEGPVFVAQCRPETTFRGPDDTPGTGMGETCDLFREIGGMLLAAQERARQGTTEVRPGEGKWWTTSPRWGGAPNDAVGDTTNNGINSDEKLETEIGGARKRSKYDRPLGSRRGSRKMTNAEKWKLVQPGPSLWDRRMRYIQIGKNPASPFDDIYMLSSINHHIAILHLRVHRRYLEVMTTGQSDFPPESDTPEQAWHELRLRRTRWYDLLNGEDRVEVFKGIWSIFHYMLRRT
ncbi:translational activator GCN1 [Aspergillus terreus]|uniref:Translational activator GCN1 n=1 Tax=Aspergillus terreus TaxID=33178 RepID=A0A5M3ZG27_ASPTE|nr:hypothetical protein ATETN484_0014014000 [Aspergillus terreus]GFF20806.1 translational activator GCN1 [Aspergillus terreus]